MTLGTTLKKVRLTSNGSGRRQSQTKNNSDGIPEKDINLTGIPDQQSREINGEGSSNVELQKASESMPRELQKLVKKNVVKV